MSELPHERIHRAALAYIREHAGPENGWRFTRLDALPERLARIARLNPDECSIVSCFIDAQRWYVMTTARVFGIAQGSPFDFSPLDVSQWRWGEAGLATIAMRNGSHLRISYETGPAAMGAIYYGRFWETRYAKLDEREQE